MAQTKSDISWTIYQWCGTGFIGFHYFTDSKYSVGLYNATLATFNIHLPFRAHHHHLSISLRVKFHSLIFWCVCIIMIPFFCNGLSFATDWNNKILKGQRENTDSQEKTLTSAKHDNTFTRDLLNCEIWKIATDFLEFYVMQRLILICIFSIRCKRFVTKINDLPAGKKSTTKGNPFNTQIINQFRSKGSTATQSNVIHTT